MGTAMKSTTPSVIAFEFYDGATEGLSLSVKEHERCYFKLIAWDKQQDRRLYAVSGVDVSKYDKLVTLLTRTQPQSTTPVWLPVWSFRDPDDRREANALIESFRASLCKSRLLALGSDIRADSLKLIEIDDQAGDMLNKTLTLNEPDDLSNWLPMFGGQN